MAILSDGPENFGKQKPPSKSWDSLINLRQALFRWQHWVETTIGPHLTQYLCLLILVYIMSLAFSFEELFGATPEEEIIKLTKTEIDLLKAKVNKKNLPEEMKEESARQNNST